MFFLANKLLSRAGIPAIHMKDPENGQGGGGGSSSESKVDDQTTDQGQKQEQAQGDKSAGDVDDTGKSKIDPEVAKLVKDVMSWKAKAKDNEEAVKTTKTAFEQLQAALGNLNVDDIKKIVEDKKTAETKDLEAKGEYARLVERMSNEHKAELSTKDLALQESQKANKDLSFQIEELTVGRAFSDSEFIRENSTLPPSIARREFGLHFDVGQNGTVVGYDKPRGASDRTMIVDGSGTPKEFDVAVQELFAKHRDAEKITRSKAKQGSESSSAKVSVEIKKDAPKTSSLDKIRLGLSESSKS